ncbi:MAG: winged helix-turn-helix transcriptional regulator [Pseudomonadota bacterium]
MSKRKPGRGIDNEGRSKKAPPFAGIPHWAFDSPAFQSLSANAQALYLHLKRLYNGFNNGQIGLSMRQAANRLHVSKGTAWNVFKELEQKGFIKKAGGGGLSIEGQGVATRWILTEVSYAGAPPTKEFMSWKPDEKQNPVPDTERPVQPEGQLGGRKVRDAA